jgi:hypothetical protein
MTLATVVAVLTVLVGGQQPASAIATHSGSSACSVTSPNHHAAPNGSDPMPNGMAQTWHGNHSIGTNLWPDGTIVFKPGGPGFVLSDGALQMKFLWLKAPGTHLTVSGQRLDGTSAPLRADIDTQFDAKGFQPSYLIFPTAGCWRVSATAGGETLMFVTSVVKIGDGPAALPNARND